MALEFIKLVKGDSPVAQVGSYGFFKLGVESSGGGGDLVTFTNATPEQISAISAEISANNMTSEQVASTYGWKIGDTKSITLTTGEVIEIRIIGFNHDDKSDGSGKAGITLQMTHCLATPYPMHTYDRYTQWKYCTMNTTTLPNIKKTMPTEWQNVIKKVNKKQVKQQYYDAETVSNDLFLLAEVELYGQQVTQPTDTGTKEGSQYEYWVSNSKVMYRDSDGDGVIDAAANWWTRSMYYIGSNSAGFSYISTSGVAVGYSYTSQSLNVSFAFCV